MKSMAVAVLLIGLFATAVACADDLSTRARQILSVTPEQAVNKALAEGDDRFLQTPVCAQGMPGFDFAGYRGVRPNPKEIWSSCEALMGTERYGLLLEMERWVTEYNKLMGTHRR
jgi:hypothetical protein